MTNVQGFVPDLVVEVTQVCDLRCPGCYAPNLYRPKAADSTVTSRPGVFLDVTQLQQALAVLNERVHKLAIRGGEPTLHPDLAGVLRVAHNYADHVYLETHGRWIKDGAPLLADLTELGTKVKMSFDSMHGSSAEDLRAATQILVRHKLDYLVAVTELTLSAFDAVRAACAFVPDEKIVFQQKATTFSELIKPRLGVVNRLGQLNWTLSVTKEMRA